MRRWLAAAAASAATAPLIALAGAVLAFAENTGHQGLDHHGGMTMSSLVAVVASLSLAFGLLAMLVVGWPSLWIASRLFARRPLVRTAVLMVEGFVIGTIYFASLNTPGILDWSDLGIGGSLGSLAALSASSLFSLFHKELSLG